MGLKDGSLKGLMKHPLRLKVVDNTRSMLLEMNAREIADAAEMYTLDQLGKKILAHEKADYFIHRFFSVYPGGEEIVDSFKRCSYPPNKLSLFTTLAKAVFWIPDEESLRYIARLNQVYTNHRLTKVLEYLGDSAILPGNPQFSVNLEFFLSNPRLVT